MSKPRIGTREEWLKARRELLERERELNRQHAELVEQRRALPWVRLEKEYAFDTEDGTKTLAELFDGRSQLVFYHAMFGPSWTAPCPGCSGLVDSLNGILDEVQDNDVTLLAMSHAPLTKLRNHRQQQGWKIPYVSSYDSGFNYDFGVSFTNEQRRNGAEYNFERVDFDETMRDLGGNNFIVETAATIGTDAEGYVTTEGPGLFVFALQNGVVYHTYSQYAPEVNPLVFHTQILDRTPKSPDDPFASGDDDGTAG